MYQGTTPTIPVKFKNVDLTSARIFITIKDEMNRRVLLDSIADFEATFDGKDTNADITLTQRQTLMLCHGKCKIQARYILPDGSAGATVEKELQMNTVLQKGVIAYEQ